MSGHSKWYRTANYDLSGKYKDKTVFTNNWSNIATHHLAKILDKTKPLKMMEIGCQEGRQSIDLLKTFLSHPKSEMYCLDVFGYEDGIPDFEIRGNLMERNFDHNIKVSGYRDKVTKMKGPSWRTLRQLNTDDDFESFDFIYVDGWHGANGVIEDAVLCWKLLKVGGIITFDDYGWRPNLAPPRRPKIAIDSFMAIYHPFYKKAKVGGRKSFKKMISNDDEIKHLNQLYHPHSSPVTKKKVK